MGKPIQLISANKEKDKKLKSKAKRVNELNLAQYSSELKDKNTVSNKAEKMIQPLRKVLI